MARALPRPEVTGSQPQRANGSAAAGQRDGGAALSGALAQLAAEMRREPVTLAAGLATITESAATVVPGADATAVVTAAPDQTLSARALHGDLAAAVMSLHAETGQGPWLDAVTRAARIRIEDIRSGDDWPLFRARAAAAGALSMLCAPITAGASVTGALCLLSGTAGAFDEQAGDLAAVFAGHAAIALAAADLVQQLRTALQTRDTIGQAKGIIMERRQLTADDAFATLARISQQTNVKLRDVAEELCRTGDLPATW